MKSVSLKRVLLILLVLCLAPMSFLLTACNENEPTPKETSSIKGIWVPVSYVITDFTVDTGEVNEKFISDKTSLRFVFDEAEFDFIEFPNSTTANMLVEDKKYEIIEGGETSVVEIEDEDISLTLINQNSIKWVEDTFDGKVSYYFSKIITNVTAELGAWEHLTNRIDNPDDEDVDLIAENLGVVRFNFNKTVLINNTSISYVKHAERISFTYGSKTYMAKFSNEGKLEISRPISGTTSARYVMIYQYAN